MEAMVFVTDGKYMNLYYQSYGMLMQDAVLCLCKRLARFYPGLLR